ncbi:non-homologous end joining protein Ku [Amycolatopsis alkalitolerans]|uniref:Non-homologous end joining protein Ku n=1 Tax=Amycolatopsis alkalitolerans TaxID=2547244 RepID=A0A5C4LWE4_9PSEU|nr:Ku protein [Amycolatopsis alkalitolerans]TNC23761.1 Ku protein [Amycolatopsis alkalitolerans]
MARPIWRGALSFGLVIVPVRLYAAVEDHSVRFRQLQQGTGDRIRNRRVNERTGEEVPYSDIVKGYPTDGEYVPVEQQELDDIAPGRSKTIDVESFAELGEIDPVLFDRAYWLGPDDEKSDRAYVLLRDALADLGKVAIARFAMRGKEYLALIRASGSVLALHTLHFAADVREPGQALPRLPGAVKTRTKEFDLAEDVVDAMTEPWRPEDYQDTYLDRVHELIEAKSSGDTVAAETGPSEPTKVVDLMDALSRSVERRRRGTSARARKNAAKDLSGMSKTDLERLAREHGVKGRSKMTKAQLEEALRAS